MIELLVDVNFNHGLVKKGTKLPKEEAKKLLKTWYKEIEDHSEDLMTIEEETEVVEDTVKEISKKKKKKK